MITPHFYGMSIGENIRKLKSLMPEGVEMVAVSKFHPASAIMEAYDAGQKIFGESRVQEFLEKESLLPKDIRWHFIGHLQTNKVRQIIGKTAMIESVDSVKLIELIDRESLNSGVVTNVLLQLHVAAEETKFGFDLGEAKAFLDSGAPHLKATKICGIMGMATNTDDLGRVRKDFATLSWFYNQVKQDCHLNYLTDFNYLSMGMSGDWQIAVEEGSNLVRIGSAIFGERIH